jgi:putative peptidoglycan lipid II flippase
MYTDGWSGQKSSILETTVLNLPQRSLTRASALATLGSVLGNLPGFFIPIAIAAVFGATVETDIFFLALSVVSLVASALSVTAQQAAIPFLVAARQITGDIGQLVGEMSVAVLSLSIVLMLLAATAVLAYVSNRTEWSSNEIGLLFSMLFLFVPYVLSSVLAGVYSGGLNAGHKYVLVAVSPAIRSTCVLMAMLLAPILRLQALVLGYVVGELVRAVYLHEALRQQYNVRLWALPRTADARAFAFSGTAQMMGSLIVAFLPVMDRMMAARLEVGRISLLDYADRLWQVPVGLALSGFMITSLAHWSERIQTDGTFRTLSRATARAALGFFCVFLMLAGVFVVTYEPILDAVFKFAKLTDADVQVIKRTLVLLVAGTPIYVAGLAYTRAFLILRRSDVLLAAAVVQLIVKAATNVWLIQSYGIIGIAGSTAIASAASSMMLIGLLHLKPQWLIYSRVD